jgi:hypothetical protein
MSSRIRRRISRGTANQVLQESPRRCKYQTWGWVVRRQYWIGQLLLTLERRCRRRCRRVAMLFRFRQRLRSIARRHHAPTARCLPVPTMRRLISSAQCSSPSRVVSRKPTRCRPRARRAFVTLVLSTRTVAVFRSVPRPSQGRGSFPVLLTGAGTGTAGRNVGARTVLSVMARSSRNHSIVDEGRVDTSIVFDLDWK